LRLPKSEKSLLRELMEEPPAEERTEAETQEGEEAPTAGTKETQKKEIEEEPQRPPRKPLLDEAILIATLLKESGTRR
jgi:hypothetical protein